MEIRCGKHVITEVIVEADGRLMGFTDGLVFTGTTWNDLLAAFMVAVREEKS